MPTSNSEYTAQIEELSKQIEALLSECRATELALMATVRHFGHPGIAAAKISIIAAISESSESPGIKTEAERIIQNIQAL